MIVIATAAVILGIIVAAHFMFLDIAAFFRGQTYIRAMVIAAAIIYSLTLACTLYPGYLAIRIHPARALQYE
jgi:hypothetical protein